MEIEEKLDKTLIFLKGIDNKGTVSWILNKSKDLNITDSNKEMLAILEKLHKDGYVIKEKAQTVFTESKEIDVYSISIEGYAILEYEGGYKGVALSNKRERERLNLLEKTQMKLSKQNLFLTWVAAIVGFLVFLIGLLQYLLSVKQQYPLFPHF